MKKRSIFAFLTLGIFVAYHRLKERRDIRDLAKHASADLKKIGISPQTYAVLPRSGLLADGKPTEWMNLIILGDKEALKGVLEKSGWYEADPTTPWTLLKSAYAILTKGQYLRGPFTPIFVNEKPQDLSYQKPDETNTFARRHHVRFWETNEADKKGNAIWVGQVSFDNGIKSTGKLPFLIVHSIDPNLDADREYLVKDLISAGAKLKDHIQFQSGGETITALGDRTFSDGRAAVLEIK